MKGQLYIGDHMVAETVEVVSPPRSGDLIIFEGKRLRIREVGHNVDRKKLQIMCHAPLARSFSVNPAEVTPAMMDHILNVGIDGPATDEDSDLGVQAERGFQYFDEETGEIKESEAE